MINRKYYEFLRFIEGKIPDTLGKDEITEATKQEIGWWKQNQIRRAIHHIRYDKATREELRLLRRHDFPISSQALERTKKMYS